MSKISIIPDKVTYPRLFLFSNCTSCRFSKTKKKKSTPNKRPASAISLTKTSNSARKEQEKSRKAKSSKLQSEPNDKEYNVGLAPSSASRDTILGYFPSASNPPKTAGTTLGNSKLNTTSPAVVAKSKVVGSSNSRLSTTSPAMPKASSGSGSRLAASTSPVPSKPSSITETAKSNGQKKIDRYFGVGKANSNNFSKEKAKQIQSLQKSDLNDEKQTIKSVLSASETSSQHLHEKIASLEKQLAEATSQNLAIKNNQTMLTLQLQATVKRQSIEIQQIKSDSEQGKNKATNIIEELIRKDSIQKSVKLRQTLASDGARLGRLVTTRRGGISRAIESWEDGEEPLKLKKRRAELKKRRKTLEQRWGELTRDNFDIGELVGDLSNDKRPMDDLEKFEARETIRMHLDELKRDERKLDEEDMACTLEKRRHVRTLKLVSNEDTSRFRFRQKVRVSYLNDLNECCCDTSFLTQHHALLLSHDVSLQLHDRYVPLNILGKGGFSEVWQAYDLQELRRVAVKIHQLEPSWSDAKKENYTKHVSREYEIHREVRHPRIVSLYDVFEIDTDSFATVLECCDGDDLDTILKDRGRLVERDARAILLQVLSGMRYLSTQSEDGKRQGIIHYDLKPGNILFDDDGRAKITDFGLSKIVDSGDYDEGMELTSQGAGTYWYLPPECFLIDQDVRIR